MKNNGAVQGKVAIITGASTGVGRETALLFAQKGAKVVAAARSREKLLELKKEIDRAGGYCSVVPTDVSRQDEVQRLIQQTHQAFGRVDILVNNAGQGLFKFFADTTIDDFRKIMEVNFYGAVFAVKAVLPIMLEQKSGLIVNVASVAGKRAFERMSAYCASKFALVGFTETLHFELIDKGIRAVAVCPPAIDTPFFVNAGYSNFKETHKGLPMLSPRQVAEVILEATRRKKREVIISRRAKVINAIHALSPELMEGITRVLTGKRA